MFRNQSTMEKKQESYLISDDLSSGSAAWRSPVCAWCLCEKGLEMGNGSHGICTQHADWLLQQHRERRARCH